MSTETITTRTADDFFLLGGDLPVRRIGLGTMRLTDATGDHSRTGAHIWRGAADPAEQIALLRGAVEAGVQLIDTADAYALGDSEELVARALHPYADDVLIATKVGNVRPSPTVWVPLGHPAYLQQQVELSLRRLRLERIDLLQLHRLDPNFPIADQVGALAELRDQGKIRHIGLSEVTVDQLDEARRTAPIASVQNLYNLSARGHDAVIDHADAAGIAFLPFFPLAIGSLASPDGAVAGVGREIGAEPSQVALTWLLRRSPNVLPIPGTGSLAHLVENLGALQVELSEEQFRRISEG
ncbi:oxidoreductase [Microbacterium bovistercoris]|uniref:Oxidoreductase n=1 Tax=Microbacterium bovistercoris TaxID=2293570 RepID=A0A371NSE7_9MICO|nr:aldo/keto reductase [Microbacterium bovistercoris]REJ05136.1 oxidoreductase [Microbacterium bovistercoris]